MLQFLRNSESISMISSITLCMVTRRVNCRAISEFCGTGFILGWKISRHLHAAFLLESVGGSWECHFILLSANSASLLSSMRDMSVAAFRLQMGGSGSQMTRQIKNAHEKSGIVLLYASDSISCRALRRAMKAAGERVDKWRCEFRFSVSFPVQMLASFQSFMVTFQ